MSLNHVMMHGRLGKKPELHSTNSGTQLTSFAIAVDRNRSNGKETDWFDCIAFGKTAEVINKYFEKGDQIVVDGHLQKREYTARDGSKRTSTDIVVDAFDFCGAKNKQDNMEAETGYVEIPNEEELPW